MFQCDNSFFLATATSNTVIVGGQIVVPGTVLKVNHFSHCCASLLQNLTASCADSLKIPLAGKM
jgi:hypothetical protein